MRDCAEALTSSTGLTVYRGDAFPEAYYGNLFLGEVANNLVHRMTLEPDGVTFKARSPDSKAEFIAAVSVNPVFGTLTLVLHDETFIKLKPTIIYTLFGAALLGGYLLNKPLLAIVFDAMFHLTEEGWRKLTLRWAVFFLVMAVVNEAVWRTQTTEFWIGFKLFGFMPLTFLYAAAQYRLLTKYAAEEK